MAHRKRKDTKLQPVTAGPGNMIGSCLVSFHFLWAILCPQAVEVMVRQNLPERKVKLFALKGKWLYTRTFTPLPFPVLSLGAENEH